MGHPLNPSATRTPEDRLSRRSEVSLLAAILLDLLAFGMAFTDIALRTRSYGAMAWQVGLILSSYFLIQVLVSPLWGRVSDRIGRKPVLLVCTSISALSMLVYGLAGSLIPILVSRILAGFAAANVPVAQAYLADTTSGSRRTAAIGRFGAALTTGLLIGFGMGGWLGELWGQQSLALVAGTFSLSAVLVLAVGVTPVLPSATQADVSIRKKWRGIALLRELPDLKPLFLVAAIGWFALACLEGTFALLIQHNLGYRQGVFGTILSFEAVIGATVQAFLLTAIVRKVNHLGALKSGFLLQGIGLALTPVAPNLATLFGASGIYAFGAGITNPTINVLCSNLTPEDRQGEMFGLLQAARSIGFIAGPTVGGILFDMHPWSPYFLAAGVTIAAAMFIKAPRRAEGGAWPRS